MKNAMGLAARIEMHMKLGGLGYCLVPPDPINDRSEPVAFLRNREVRFHRLASPAIDRQDILRARREGDYHIHFCAQPHVAAGLRLGWRGEG